MYMIQRFGVYSYWIEGYPITTFLLSIMHRFNYCLESSCVNGVLLHQIDGHRLYACCVNVFLTFVSI